MHAGAAHAGFYYVNVDLYVYVQNIDICTHMYVSQVSNVSI